MTTGLRIINNAGTILIDSESKVLALRAMYDYTNNNYSVGLLYGIDNAKNPQFFYSDIPGLLIIRTHIYWKGYQGTGADDRAEVRVQAALKDDGDSVWWTNFRAWVFDEPVDDPSTYGLKLYNSAGELTFDALQKTGRVVGIIEGEGTMAVPAGRKYAIGLLSEAYKWDNDVPISSIPDSTYPSNWYVHHGLRTAVWANDTEVGVKYGCFEGHVQPDKGGSNVLEITFGAHRAIVMDVTGY